MPPLPLLAVPLVVWAAAASPADDQLIVRLFWVLAVMLLAGKFAGEFFERIGQPAVLGELIVGALLGPSLLGVIPIAASDPLTEVIKIFAEIGVVVLLFEIGLETDLRQLLRVGPGASSIALVGVALPFLFGFLYWISPLTPDALNIAHGTTTAIFVGATLTATSVGITVRVLKDLRVMGTVESKLVLGAAIIDDVLGLVILGVVASLVAGASVGFLDVAKAFGIAVGFLAAALALGLLSAPKIFDLINRMRVRGMLVAAAFAFTLLIAAFADFAGSAMIIGAFAAGLILSGTNQFDVIEERIRPVADIFTPIFFLSIGAQLDLGLLNPFTPGNAVVLEIGGVLFAVAVIGKVVAGWAVPWRTFNRLAVGIGMVPRGEVGLIFANIGLNSGVLSPQLFGAILIMVIGTTFIAPPLLKWSFERGGKTPQPEPGRPSIMEPLPELLGESEDPTQPPERPTHDR